MAQVDDLTKQMLDKFDMRLDYSKRQIEDLEKRTKRLRLYGWFLTIFMIGLIFGFLLS